MEQQTVKAGGREIAVRGLLRKEVKAIKKKGIDLGALSPSRADDALNEIFSLVLSPANIEFLDEQVNTEALFVFRAIMELTYGSRAEEKN